MPAATRKTAKAPWGSAVLLLGLLLPLQASEKTYEFVGKIVPGPGVSFNGLTVGASIYSTSASYSARTFVDRGGNFKFKRLPAGMYTLIVSVPRSGVLRQTVDIGPSFADRKDRIFKTVRFEQRPRIGRSYSVSSTQLAIPESARNEYRKAVEFLEKKDTNAAFACLTRAVEIAPEFAAAWNRLGRIASQLNQYDRAAGYFREALRYNPDSYGALVNLGGVLLTAGKTQEAIEANRRAVDSRPDDPLAHAQLGYCYLNQNQFENAEMHLRKAKELDPGHFSFPQLALAAIYWTRQHAAAAIDELEEFLSLHPDSDRATEIRKWLEGARSGRP